MNNNIFFIGWIIIGFGIWIFSIFFTTIVFLNFGDRKPGDDNCPDKLFILILFLNVFTFYKSFEEILNNYDFYLKNNYEELFVKMCVFIYILFSLIVFSIHFKNKLLKRYNCEHGLLDGYYNFKCKECLKNKIELIKNEELEQVKKIKENHNNKKKYLKIISLIEMPRDNIIVRNKDYKRGNPVDNYIRNHLFEEICSIFNNKCFKCKSTENLTLDHLWLSKNEGGNFVIIEKKHNILVNNSLILCNSCNSSKSDKNYKKIFSKEELSELVKYNYLLLDMFHKNPYLLRIVNNWYDTKIKKSDYEKLIANKKNILDEKNSDMEFKLEENFCKLRLLAENNDIQAQYELGMVYYNRKGIYRDLEKAQYWFNKMQENQRKQKESG